jgi:lactate permease
MNTVPVVFGAVGMPIWFGLGEIDLTADELRAAAMTASVVQCAAAPIVVAFALQMLFPWRALRARLLAIGAVIVATVGASTITALFSLEFPTIVGGVCGVIAAFAIGRRINSSAASGVGTPPIEPSDLPLWRAAFPLVATVALLAVTRIEPLGLRGLLTAETPAATVQLGPVGEFSVSAALVARLDDILGTDIAWSMPMLYVPFIIPFVVVVMLSAPLLRLSARRTVVVARDAATSLLLPAVALAGALVFVKLMMHGGDAAPVVTIGRALADGVAAVHGPLWLGAAPLVGALGSFFSGSATVSNLTFAPVQVEIAQQLNLETTCVLGLQAIGAAMGNMVCVHNIVAVAAVLGLTSAANRQPNHARDDEAGASVSSRVDDPVAAILRLNALPLAAFALVAAVTAVALATL